MMQTLVLSCSLVVIATALNKRAKFFKPRVILKCVVDHTVKKIEWAIGGVVVVARRCIFLTMCPTKGRSVTKKLAREWVQKKRI